MIVFKISPVFEFVYRNSTQNFLTQGKYGYSNELHPRFKGFTPNDRFLGV